MKKIFFFLVFILLTGCGNKQILECDTESNNLSSNIVFNYSNDKIKSIDLKYIYNLEKYEVKDIELFKKENYCNIVNDSSDIFKDAIKNCNQNINNSELVVNAQIDISKIDKNKFDKDSNINSVKDSFEKSGANCKIKK